MVPDPSLLQQAMLYGIICGRSAHGFETYHLL